MQPGIKHTPPLTNNATVGLIPVPAMPSRAQRGDPATGLQEKCLANSKRVRKFFPKSVSFDADARRPENGSGSYMRVLEHPERKVDKVAAQR